MSSTAISAESTRTQASTQSPRPATACGLRRTLMSGGRPSRAASRKKGLRGRFGNYVPPVLEVLGLAEVEHNARNNRMRAR